MSSVTNCDRGVLTTSQNNNEAPMTSPMTPRAVFGLVFVFLILTFWLPMSIGILDCARQRGFEECVPERFLEVSVWLIVFAVAVAVLMLSRWGKN